MLFQTEYQFKQFLIECHFAMIKCRFKQNAISNQMAFRKIFPISVHSVLATPTSVFPFQEGGGPYFNLYDTVTKARATKPQLTVWNSGFIIFSFIIEGTSKKLLQYLTPPEPIYNKNVCFNE